MFERVVLSVWKQRDNGVPLFLTYRCTICKHMSPYSSSTYSNGGGTWRCQGNGSVRSSAVCAWEWLNPWNRVHVACNRSGKCWFAVTKGLRKPFKRRLRQSRRQTVEGRRRVNVAPRKCAWCGMAGDVGRGEIWKYDRASSGGPRWIRRVAVAANREERPVICGNDDNRTNWRIWGARGRAGSQRFVQVWSGRIVGGKPMVRPLSYGSASVFEVAVRAVWCSSLGLEMQCF